MKEELLHYVWKTKSLPVGPFTTTDNEKLTIEKFGYYNLNSGPDFLEGSVTVDGIMWAGHIEIHILASDWIKHRHEIDRAYQNVILHVVWEEDEIIYRQDGTRIPCLELKELVSPYLLTSYTRLSTRKALISCSQELKMGDNDHFYLQLHRMFIERLEAKCYPISLELENNSNDWSQILFFMLARSLGLKVNGAAMEELSRSIPINLVAKHSEQLFQLEALFLGQAGMLSEKWADDYPQRLAKEYQFLREKYGLISLSGEQWKLLRMRPTSFPTIRISQLASLYHQDRDLHAHILKAKSIEALRSLFQVSASNYWDNHFLFDRASGTSVKKIGKATVDSMIINGIIPFLFAYGQYRGEDAYTERAIEFMQSIASEKNKIIKMWQDLGIKSESAFTSQALLQLHKNYCSRKRCLECSFGNKVLKKISTSVQEENMKYSCLSSEITF